MQLVKKPGYILFRIGLLMGYSVWKLLCFIIWVFRGMPSLGARNERQLKKNDIRWARVLDQQEREQSKQKRLEDKEKAEKLREQLENQK